MRNPSNPEQYRPIGIVAFRRYIVGAERDAGDIIARVDPVRMFNACHDGSAIFVAEI
jgi:hypothetical protein